MQSVADMMWKLWRNDTAQKIIIIVFFVVVGVKLGYFFFFQDPDYFWHFTEGEYIVAQKSIAYADRYSFSMPDFKWINHEWLSDVILYAVESRLGLFALGSWYVLLFSMTVAALVFLKKKRLNVADIIIGLLGTLIVVEFSGVRQQTYSYLFFALMMYVLLSGRKKMLWLLPAIFLVWANVHSAFTGGFLVLGMLCAYTFIAGAVYKRDDGKDWKTYMAVSFLSFAATFINPYGWRLYEVIFMTVSDNYLTKYISEWLPLFLNVNMRYVVFIALFLALFTKEARKKIPPEYLVVIIVFFLLPLRSVKYAPFFVLVALPALFRISDGLFSDAHMNHYRRIIKSPVALLLVPVLLGAALLVYNPYIVFVSEEVSYPSEAAVSALVSDNGGRTFNFYGWGGYLIRYAPQKKYFIDGRMPSWWTDEEYAFRDYVDAYTCEKTEEIFGQYDIDTVFWYSGNRTKKFIFDFGTLERFDNWISKKVAKVFGMNTDEQCDLVKELKELGWHETFNDGNAVILKQRLIL